MVNKYQNSISPKGLMLEVSVHEIGKKNKTRISGKIDTGAFITTIPQELQTLLGLKPREPIRVKGAFDKVGKLVPTFYITLGINSIYTSNIQVISTPNDFALIGRDILNQLILHADGPNKVFELVKE